MILAHSPNLQVREVRNNSNNNKKKRKMTKVCPLTGGRCDVLDVPADGKHGLQQ
jgi:hypothetical protein